MTTMPEKVPDVVIDSIAKSHVKYERQGECPKHDGRWAGCYVARYEHVDGVKMEANVPCTCAVKMARFQDILKALSWSFDHYYFNFAGMYVGVELDGYMHT